MNILHICYDNVLNCNGEKYFDDFDNQNYKQFRGMMIEIIEKIITDSENFESTKKLILNWNLQVDINFPKQLHQDVIIIIDDNNYYRSMRYEFYKIARKYETCFMEFFFPLTLEECLMRNSQRTGSDYVPELIIKQMYIRIELPNSNLKWEKNAIKINADQKYDIKNILVNIKDQLNNPVPKPENTDVTFNNCKQSMIHKIDLHLRKIIAIKMKENFNYDAKYYAQELNLKRKQILTDLRNGIIHIPLIVDEINGYF